MDKRLRAIFMITPFFRPNIGGVETHLGDLCDRLIAGQNEILVLTYQPLVTRVRAPGQERRKRLVIKRISWFGHGIFDKLEHYPGLELVYLFPALYFRALLFILLRNRRVDVIYTHGLAASLVGRLMTPVSGKTRIATIHTIYNLSAKPALGKILTWVLRPYDKILFVSERIRKEFVDSGVDAKKTAILTYWADQARFRPLDKQESKKILNWSSEFNVLFVGRLIEEKGISVLVDTARTIREEIRFVFVTSGTYPEFERLAGGDIPSNVLYVGPVDYSKLHLYYSAADLLVSPSQRREGFSRAVLESALCGTPVVASNIGCLPEIVNPQIGDLIDPPTSENFARAIQYYYNHREDLRELSKVCAKYAHDRFTANNADVIEQSFPAV